MKPPLKAGGVFVYDADEFVVCQCVKEYAARYIVAAVNACHAAGLTVEQLEAGVITNLVNLEKTFSDFCQQQSDTTQPDSATP